MERNGLVPIVDLTDADAKARWIPAAGYGQLIIDSGNSNKLSWMNAAGTVVVLATV